MKSLLLMVVATAAAAAAAFSGCAEIDSGEAIEVQAAKTADPAPLSGGYGMTWVKASHDNTRGQDTVSCHDYVPGQLSCNPYTGDTSCSLARRILCIRQDGSANNGFPYDPTNSWAGGNIGLTHPVVGTSMTSLAVANAQCVAEFGAGWKMASFHDGASGWKWTAYGNLNDVYRTGSPSHTATDRFWVNIADQPGNCWN